MKPNRLLIGILALALVGCQGNLDSFEEGILSNPIRNGVEQPRSSFPAVVPVFTAPGGLCSGSVIGERSVLTAAHCVDHTSGVSGASEVAIQLASGEFRVARDFHIHPQWNLEFYIVHYPSADETQFTRTFLGAPDLALINFAEDLNVTPLPIQSQNLPEDAAVEVIGYGNDENFNTGLRTGEMIVAAQLQGYNGNAQPSGLPTAHIISVPGPADNVMCHGDSGGPLLLNGRLAGVVSKMHSFSAFDCLHSDHSIFSAVSSYRSWILSVMDQPVPWTNPTDRLDVNGDGYIAPIDALYVINHLNSTTGAGSTISGNNVNRTFLDVTNDGLVTPLDALLIINSLNSVGAHPVFDLSRRRGLFGSNKTMMTAALAGDEQLMSLGIAELAYEVDTALNLRNYGNYYLNYGGQKEKWLVGGTGWHFILPSGHLFRATSYKPALGTIVALLTPEYYADPSRLHEALPPTNGAKGR